MVLSNSRKLGLSLKRNFIQQYKSIQVFTKADIVKPFMYSGNFAPIGVANQLNL